MCVCGCAVLFRCFCAPTGWGQGIFVRIFRVFPIDGEKTVFPPLPKYAADAHAHVRAHSGTHTQTYAFYLFICGYLSGVVGRVSRFWAATFRSSFAPVLKSSSLQLFRRPCCAGIFFSPFFLKKKLESGWVRGNPPTQHQKWTDESSGCELREGWTGGSKAIFKRKFTVCVPTMK